MNREIAKAQRQATASPGLLEKLMAAVRPEFRSDLVVFDPRDPVFGGPACAVPGCVRTARSQGLCPGHHQRWWRREGKPDLARFIATTDQQVAGPLSDSPTSSVVPACECKVSLAALAPQLKLEVQYVLQCRRDERLVRTQVTTVARMVRLLAGLPVASLLDWDEETLRTAFGRPAPKDAGPRTLVIYGVRKLEDLAEDHGWDTEYRRDVWRLRRLGRPTGGGSPARLRFNAIAQPWLKELAKRWVRWRLSTGLGSTAAARCVTAITRFAQFLATHEIGIDSLASVDRPVLERYLADLHVEFTGRPAHRTHVRLLNQFFNAIRQHSWDSSLPTTATFYPEDYPKHGEQLPRAVAEYVMVQVEHPSNLDQWDHPAYRLVTLILIRCGLRVSDALKLPFDCVVLDAEGAPYLRYHNHKMNREALVPIDEQLQQSISEQQQHVLGRWTDGVPVLFPRPLTNPDGSKPVNSATYRQALHRWLQRCDIRDEHGRPVHLTPHQWRHSLGTRLINRDVPQEVVRRILDHDSHLMTGHYARLSDTTIRRHWEAARKVNANGETVTLDPDGPLAEASWAKQRISRATQALPNGYCSLPLIKTCPHANSCLTCPMFITTTEFLPQHRHHQQQVLQIITAAEARGQTRMVEMNRQVADNLAKIITTLENGEANTSRETSADAS
ncbi:tyrosine-type recombinase/integrase [Saccharopolyspora pogona]|uniref:tyrosine-type recombinase/integrase n=1 Tax=Saccharopolyspora pogona TaxID=333966 RepID=UPI001CC26AAF|nr:site-specific integrase [Saccharopolyspora pogona]